MTCSVVLSRRRVSAPFRSIRDAGEPRRGGSEEAACVTVSVRSLIDGSGDAMKFRVWVIASGGIAATLLSATVAGCGDSGDLTFWNGGTEAVTVTTDHDTFDLPPNNGSSLLDNGCNKGDVTVTFASGKVFVIAGPVCPEHQIVIRDGNVALQPA
jgi:hypothetical protein